MENSKIKFVEAFSAEDLEKEIINATTFHPGYIVTNVDKCHISMGKFDGFVAKMEYDKI